MFSLAGSQGRLSAGARASPGLGFALAVGVTRPFIDSFLFSYSSTVVLLLLLYCCYCCFKEVKCFAYLHLLFY